MDMTYAMDVSFLCFRISIGDSGDDFDSTNLTEHGSSWALPNANFNRFRARSIRPSGASRIWWPW